MKIKQVFQLLSAESILLGFGSDNKIYFWDKNLADWKLYKNE